MARPHIVAAHHASPQFRVQKLTLDHPWNWLAKGWQDLSRAPAVSLTYGLLFALAGYALFAVLYYSQLFYLFFPLLSGFLLVGPVVAVGLYDISRRLEEGEPVSLRHALNAWGANAGQIAALGVALMLVFVAWIQLATLVFALFYQGVVPTWESFINVVFLRSDSFPLLAASVVVGGGMAAVVFSISALSVPLLLDSPTNAMDAMRFSVQAVRRNPRPMLLWAAIIVASIGVGLVTFLLGLVVMLPLVGHATWHAYRDTMGRQ